MVDQSAANIETGEAGEVAVAELLLKRGYKVEFGPIGGPDLIVEDHTTVEVKTANLSARTDKKVRRWQFNLTKLDGSHSPMNEDLLILRCNSTPPCHFIIPGMLIDRKLQRIDIPNEDPRKYRGQYHLFRERWELADAIIQSILWLCDP